MNFLIFSDLHAHPFKPYATILPNGMNSRLSDIVSCVKQILDYCIEHPEVELVLFGGDLFHTRGRLAVQAFNAIYEVLAGFSIRKIPLMLIHGNHDQADREGSVYSIHTLRTVAEVVDKPGWTMVTTRTGQDVAVMAVPYTENVAHLRDLVKTPFPGRLVTKVPTLFLGHLGIQGAKVGSDFVYTNPYDAAVDDLNLPGFDAAFLGHYHMHQRLTANAWYIGAPLQHTWGDRGQERGFVIYDSETRQIERHMLSAPRFEEVQVADVDRVLSAGSWDFQSSFLRVLDSRAWSDDEREDVRIRLDARSLEVCAPVKPETANRQRVNITLGMSYRDILQLCIENGTLAVDPGLDPEYLVQLGSEILQEVDDAS
jgi:DNA repair exonuclease SbcCD nuclease subunit